MREVLANMNLDMKQSVGNSTASNMQGQYKGFSTLLSEKSPHQIHVWCYSHILNFVLADATQSILESGSLFSLINNIVVFIRESYQRMSIWEKEKHAGGLKTVLYPKYLEPLEIQMVACC